MDVLVKVRIEGPEGSSLSKRNFSLEAIKDYDNEEMVNDIPGFFMKKGIKGGTKKKRRQRKKRNRRKTRNRK